MNEDDNICAICLEECQDTYETPCHHQYCDGCIHKVPRTTKEKEGIMIVGVDCPLCREFVMLPEADPPNLLCENTAYRIFVCIGTGITGGTGAGLLYILFNVTNNMDGGINNYSLALAVMTGVVIFWIFGVVGIVRRRLYGIYLQG